MTSEPRASGRAAGRPRRARPRPRGRPRERPRAPTTTTKTRGRAGRTSPETRRRHRRLPFPGSLPRRDARRCLRSRPRPPWRRLRTTTAGRLAARRTRSRPNLPRTRRGEKIPPRRRRRDRRFLRTRRRRRERRGHRRRDRRRFSGPPPARFRHRLFRLFRRGHRRRDRRQFLRTRRPRRFVTAFFRLFRLFRLFDSPPPGSSLTFRRRRRRSGAAERDPPVEPFPSVAFWRAVGAALGIDSSGNPLRAPTASTRTNASAAFEGSVDAGGGSDTLNPSFDPESRGSRGRPRVGGGAPARPSRSRFPSTRTENFFCSNKTEPRYYAADYACACDCAGCDCRRYYACWDCGLDARTGTRRCLSQASYLCARGDFSFFNEKRQACAWEQPRPLPFGCPPRPPGPPLPPKPPMPPRAPFAPPPPSPSFPGAPPAPPAATLPSVSGRRRRVPGGGPPRWPTTRGSPRAFPGVAAAGRGVVQPGVGVGAQASARRRCRRTGCRRATSRTGRRRTGCRRRSGAADAARLVLEHPDVRLVSPVRGPRDVRVLLRRRVRRLEPRDAAGASRGVLGVLR